MQRNGICVSSTFKQSCACRDLSTVAIPCSMRFRATAAHKQSSRFAYRGSGCTPCLVASPACQFYDLSMPLFSLPAASKTLMETLETLETLESSAVALGIDTTTRARLSRSVQLAFDTDPQAGARPAHDDGR